MHHHMACLMSQVEMKTRTTLDRLIDKNQLHWAVSRECIYFPRFNDICRDDDSGAFQRSTDIVNWSIEAKRPFSTTFFRSRFNLGVCVRWKMWDRELRQGHYFPKTVG